MFLRIPLCRPFSSQVRDMDLTATATSSECQAASSSPGKEPRAIEHQNSYEGDPQDGADETWAEGITTTVSEGLRSGRRTLTASVTPSLPGKPVRYGVHSIQNQRSEMEDAHRAVLGVESQEEVADSPLGSLSYFAIFDGHGGVKAAEFSGERLYALLAEKRDELLTEPEEALRRAFAQTEEDWLTLAVDTELMDGTTAAVALVDRMARRCVVGNVGDSEVLLGTRYANGEKEVKTLTEVHHLKRSPAEADRVTAVGGRVWRGRLGHPKISPQVVSLAVSRAIGDLFFKDDKYTGGKASGLSAEPYITSVEVCAPQVADQFLLLGCDGLWDTVSYDEAADFIFSALSEGRTPQAISEALVGLARDKGSSDNITVMVVVL